MCASGSHPCARALLQVELLSTQLVELDEASKEHASETMHLKAMAENAEQDNQELQTQVAELEGDLQSKLALLDEFEHKFQRQFDEWQEREKELLDNLDAYQGCCCCGCGCCCGGGWGW